MRQEYYSVLCICMGNHNHNHITPSCTLRYTKRKQNANSALLGPEHEVRTWPGWIGWLEYYGGTTNDDHCQLERCVPWLGSESYPGLRVKRKCLKIKYSVFRTEKIKKR